MTQSATFRVTTAAGDVVTTYPLAYTDAKHLNALYQEARQIWAEYFVTAETPAYDLSDSHTYREQLALEMYKDTDPDLEELQWDYMNGEYPDEC